MLMGIESYYATDTTLKIFKILSYPYRNRGKRFGLRANLIAGLHNYDLAN